MYLLSSRGTKVTEAGTANLRAGLTLLQDARFELRVGDRVRVKPSVTKPRYGWGSVSHESIGIITSINGRDCYVDFLEQSGWTGQLKEMVYVSQ